MVAFIAFAAVAGLGLFVVARRRPAPVLEVAPFEGEPRLRPIGIDELRVAYPELGDEIGTFRMKPRLYVGELASGVPVAFAVDPGDDWVDVYARQQVRGERDDEPTGDYDCFGFSLLEDRFALAVGPAAGREIRSLLHELRTLD